MGKGRDVGEECCAPPCSKLKAPGPSIVPAAKLYPMAGGQVWTCGGRKGGEGRRKGRGGEKEGEGRGGERRGGEGRGAEGREGEGRGGEQVERSGGGGKERSERLLARP